MLKKRIKKLHIKSENRFYIQQGNSFKIQNQGKLNYILKN